MAEQDMEQPHITITFDNRSPVELGDLTLSLLAFADEYRRFTSRQIGAASANDAKLYVGELRKGSIVADLVPYVAQHSHQIIPAITAANAAIGFGKHVKGAVDYLLGKIKKPDEDLEKTTLQNIAKLLEPTAKDPGAKVTIVNCVGDNNNVLVASVDDVQSRAIQNQIEREIKSMRAPASGIHENVLLYWHHPKNDLTSTTGEKAIIEKFSRAPVKTVVPSPAIKARMIRSDINPFTVGYLVDVDVQTVRDKPALYTVLAFHDVVSLDDEGDQLPMLP